MAISEEQLQTWTNAPSSTKIQFTHEHIRRALKESESLQNKDYEVYLQGSYANSTNIRNDSDVDIVVQLNSTFQHNIDSLPLADQTTFHQVFSTATYGWLDFRQDVVTALENYFGSEPVNKNGNKSIKLAADPYRVNADVVPCLQYRKYSTFNNWSTTNFIEGIKFWTVRENKEIINYPKIHIKNGEEKNAQHRTDEMYKHLVRIIKNIRRQLVEKHRFDATIAPSYFIESAVYNVPDTHFQTDYKTTLEYVLDYILRRCNAPSLVTVSHQHQLFGNEPWQWNEANAANFFDLVEQFYKIK